MADTAAIPTTTTTSSMYGMRVVSATDDRVVGASSISTSTPSPVMMSLSQQYGGVTSSNGVMTFGSVAQPWTPPTTGAVTYAVPELTPTHSSSVTELKPVAPTQAELDRALITTIRSLDSSLDHVTLCRNHLHAGASPSAISVEGVSALHWASFCKLPAVVELLIAHNAKLDDLTPTGQTALHWSGISGDVRCAKPLLNAGCRLDAPDHKGLTPLHIAAQYDMQPCVDYMLLRGADINCVDYDGMTPLHHAIQLNLVFMVDLLIRRGVNQAISDKQGRLALHIAVHAGNYPLIKRMMTYHGSRRYLTYRNELQKTLAQTAQMLPNQHLYEFLQSLETPWYKYGFRMFLTEKGQPRLAPVVGIWVVIWLMLWQWHQYTVLYRWNPYPQWWHTTIWCLSATSISSWFIAHFSDPGRIPSDAPAVASPTNSSDKSSNDATLDLLLPSSATNDDSKRGGKSSTTSLANYSDDYGHGGICGAPRTPQSIWSRFYRRWLTSRTSPVWAARYRGALESGQYDMTCLSCRIVKPLRSKHCSACDRCVLRFDHHCGWVDNCIGMGNYRSFFVFVWSTSLVADLYVLNCWSYFDNVGYFSDMLSFGFWCHALFMGLFVNLLGISHLYLVSSATTTNESINFRRYAYLWSNGRSHNPFNKGCLRNWLECMRVTLEPIAITPPAGRPVRHAPGHAHSHGHGGRHHHSTSSTASGSSSPSTQSSFVSTHTAGGVTSGGKLYQPTSTNFTSTLVSPTRSASASLSSSTVAPMNKPPSAGSDSTPSDTQCAPIHVPFGADGLKLQ